VAETKPKKKRRRKKGPLWKNRFFWAIVISSALGFYHSWATTFPRDHEYLIKGGWQYLGIVKREHPLDENSQLLQDRRGRWHLYTRLFDA
jgi:hypothetical protein